LLQVESVRAIEPSCSGTHKDGSVDVVKLGRFSGDPVPSLRPDSKVPWNEYYTVAREASRRYARRASPARIPDGGLAVFRRSVIGRVTDELGGSEYADEVCPWRKAASRS